MPDPTRKRILIYSHDTYGLGHLRRSLLVAEHLVRTPEAPLVLIVTGSPKAQAFRLPDGVDCLKLPEITKDPAGNYRPRTLDVSLERILEMRTEILFGSVRGFAPDLVLVDHAPVGVEGELIPVFNDLLKSGRRPRFILGLRDVIDDAVKVAAEWERFSVERYLESLYDRVIVYGDPRVMTTAQELGLPSAFPGKLVFAGYLGREPLPGPVAATGDDRPLVLVTTGGGGDGQKILRAYASYLNSFDGSLPFRSVIVTGPFLSRRRQGEILPRFEDLGDAVEIVRFTNQIEGLIERATAIISMGGYNSVMEIMASGVPALVVPRTFPRREQEIRAERLEPHTNIQVAAMNRDLPGRMAGFVEHALANPARIASKLDHGGLEKVAAELIGLLSSSTRPTHSRGESTHDVRTR